MKKVKIKWVDSFQTHGWQDNEIEIDYKASKCESIGYVYEETKDFITICQSFNSDGVANLLTIPKVAITNHVLGIGKMVNKKI